MAIGLLAQGMVIAALCGSAASTAAAEDRASSHCKPPYRGAVAFADPLYRGTCIAVVPGTEKSIAKGRSVMVDSFAEVVLCTRFMDAISCQRVSRSMPQVIGTAEGGPVYLRVGTSMENGRRCQPVAKGAVLMADPRGEGPCVHLAIGRFTTPKSLGLAPGRRSSVGGAQATSVPPGFLTTDDWLHVRAGQSVQIRLCRGERGDGPCEDVGPDGTAAVSGLKSADVRLLTAAPAVSAPAASASVASP